MHFQMQSPGTGPVIARRLSGNSAENPVEMGNALKTARESRFRNIQIGAAKEFDGTGNSIGIEVGDRGGPGLF